MYLDLKIFTYFIKHVRVIGKELESCLFFFLKFLIFIIIFCCCCFQFSLKKRKKFDWLCVKMYLNASVTRSAIDNPAHLCNLIRAFHWESNFFFFFPLLYSQGKTMIRLWIWLVWSLCFLRSLSTGCHSYVVISQCSR